MSYTVRQESFASLESFRNGPDNGLNWNSVFVLPAWMKVWWKVFGGEQALYPGALIYQSSLFKVLFFGSEKETTRQINAGTIAITKG